MKVAVCGASGFAGAELVRICEVHPDFELQAVFADRSAGTTISQSHSGLFGIDLAMLPTEDLIPTVESMGIELVFLALPHNVSQRYVPGLLDLGVMVVDLGADFRIKDPVLYEQWYGHQHERPELLSSAVYGLVEFNRDELLDARFISAPGCYVTAATLVIKPLLDAGLVESNPVVVDAASGVSGAGRSTDLRYSYTSVEENFSAYGLRNHRHTVEMEANTGASILFTPHLAPMTRGILATCYMRATDLLMQMDRNEADALVASCYSDAFADAIFVEATNVAPSTRMTYGSNRAFVYGCLDRRTGWVLGISALDNLLKGAAGQAVQAANVALGLPEDSGLNRFGVWP